MKKGFTLIELLVVVLIIGILAAVALPQYTKAVEKSRAAEAMQVLGDLATAEQLYYMAKNTFVTASSDTELDKLDLSFPGYNAACVANGAAGANAIETNSYCVTLATGGTDSKSVVATATRKSGTYAGKTLTIQVDPDGKVTRGGSDELKALATTWAN